MKTLMIIETTHGGMIFSLMYLAAFLAAAGVMVFQGAKKGYPMVSWMLILLTGVVFFIIGDKAINYTYDQWSCIFSEFRLPETDEKNALGGIIGLLAGIGLASLILRFKRPVFDNLAIALPVALAISRVGCLFAGCCFGTTTTFPAGIHYDQASFAAHAHLAQGLVNLNDPVSLAIHPVQLYQVIGCLLIAFLVYRSRNHWKSSGSLFLFSILCYGIMRFFMEFMVDPTSNLLAGKGLWGINLVQWFILAAFFPALIMLYFREKISTPETTENLVARSSDFRQIVLMMLIAMIVFPRRSWFDLLEFSMILLFLIPVTLLLFISVYRNYTVAGYRLIIPLVFICCLSLMAQQNIPDKTKPNNSAYMEIGVSGLIGRYAEELQRIEGGCNHEDFTYKTITKQSVPIYQGGVSAGYCNQIGKYNKVRVGAMIFYGHDDPENKEYRGNSSLSLGISPYFSYDWQNFGMQLGMSLGEMKIPVGKPPHSRNSGDVISVGHSSPVIFPALSVRLGPQDVFYVDAAYSAMFPFAVPYPHYRLGFGTGFGKTDGTAFKVGYCGDGFYTRFVLPFNDIFVIEASYADNFSTGTKTQRMFTLGFNYRLSLDK